MMNLFMDGEFTALPEGLSASINPAGVRSLSCVCILVLYEILLKLEFLWAVFTLEFFIFVLEVGKHMTFQREPGGKGLLTLPEITSEKLLQLP